MNPYSPAFVPGSSSQRFEDRLAILNSNTPHPNDSISTGSQVPALQSLNMSSQVLPRPNKNSYGSLAYSQPSMISQLPYQPRQTEIVSPVTRRATSSLIQQLNKLEIQEPSMSAQAIAEYRQSVDKATNPSEMPIGSLVDFREPPSFGVVKISNIPYSITKQEILQFLGRQARLITPEQGCPIHIIMERSTAKTMDCYAEFQTHADARETANRINRIYESGRPPRLGNRHVDVDLTDQNELLKDLFPRAKCIVWRGGMPYPQENSDPYCSGFTGFFTAEEIILAIRHAEIPHRSPFCDKCPQRTYESTISTLHKFPWYAPQCYTVHDRNQLFELVNRHIQSLVSRIQRVNTVGLDQKLLNDLLQAGLNCPAFNERQKYTLCINSEISSEIIRLPETSKWFPFDSLARKPNFNEDIYTYFMTLISQGSEHEFETMGLSNTFPKDVPALRSPFGQIWFEWPQSASQISWETAVHHEMVILCTLVFNGWMNDDMNNVFNDRRVYGESSLSLAPGNGRMLRLSPSDTERSQVLSHSDAHVSHFRRASESVGIGGVVSPGKARNTWNHRLLLYPPGGHRRGHRNTQSSPMCLPSPTTNPWGDLSSE